MHSVTIHKYTGSLTAIEFGPQDANPDNFLIFIGGLTDGFLTVPYVPPLALAVEVVPGSKWVVVQALISSSYLQFGFGSVQRDAKELGQLVEYLRTHRGSSKSKIVLMGHSTGCQDTIEYISKYSKSLGFDKVRALDGAILQAPVSDAEAFREFEAKDTLEYYLNLAKKYIEEGKPDELLPTGASKLAFGAPCTAYRFHSFAGERGDDDYFSSYLSSEDYAKSFGVIETPLLVLFSGSDEFVPARVNKDELVQRWRASTPAKFWSKHSKVVRGASHNVGPKSEKGAEADVINTVVAFLGELD